MILKGGYSYPPNATVDGLLGLDSDEQVFPCFSSIKYETNLSSSADDATLQKLIHDVEAQCPVMDMLTRNMEIDGVTNINNDDQPPS